MRPVSEGVNRYEGRTDLTDLAVYGEYTFHLEERFSAIAGTSVNWYGLADGFRLSPRVTLKYQPVKALVLRLNGGRGIRAAMPLTDNIGVFSTGKLWSGIYDRHLLEDA